MALADRRPLGVPVGSTHASPAFNPDGLSSPQTPSMKPTIADLKGPFAENDIAAYNSDPSVSPTEMSPNSRSISPDSLMNSGSVNAKKTDSSNSSRGSTPSASLQEEPESSHLAPGSEAYEKSELASNALKKSKQAARVPIATGISTTIPVTGEKPKPAQEGDASLEDDVLFAIFLILYEKDVEGTGMTVKQICDVLVERHPEMAQLSSKTSNLVSAKLNAYVKRVEKGDSNLKYALSREWADASPKRMVYVYRGLLAKDFHVHVKNAMESQKQVPGSLKFVPGTSSPFPADSFEAAKQSALSKPRRQTMFDLGISRHAFSDNGDTGNLFVPYSSAPVAANMAKSNGDGPASAGSDQTNPKASDAVALASPAPESGPSTAGAAKKFINDSDFDIDDLEVFNESEDDDVDDFSVEFMKKSGKRSKSMSHLTVNKKAKFVTAAAAAPRVPRTPCSHNPHAAAAAAALHAAALKAIAAANSGSLASKADKSHGSAGSKPEFSASAACSPKSKSNWAHAVRSGFLTQEIGAPEDVSLSDLDKLFA